jgi:hypothetical protein
MGASGAHQFHGGGKGVGANQLSLLQQGRQPEVHPISTRYRDANPRLVRIRNLVDRGASRHQIGEIALRRGRRKIDLLGSLRVNHEKRHVPCIGLGAFENRAGSWIFDGHEIHSDPRCECAPQVYIRPAALLRLGGSGCNSID